MLSPLAAQSTLTERYQTTVPEPVRRALGLTKHDKIAYREENGRVYLERADEAADPILTGFLTFLASDMAANPDALRALPAALADRLAALTRGAKIDLDAPLSPGDE
jgi:antitoxin PrlF